MPQRPMRKQTSAWPLALAAAGVAVYASLYPFSGWRDQGLWPWAFLAAPWPRYWTRFDLIVNLLGYSVLGFLLALSFLRGSDTRWPVGLASLAAAALSLAMETLQVYLPARVPSNLDFLLNVIGAWLGALLAWLLERLGVLQRWSDFRRRWFMDRSSGVRVLLALWPVALLFPAPVPLGLGQVMQRLEDALVALLAGTPYLEWIPLRDVEFQPLLPGAEMLCVSLGLLVPTLMAYAIVRQRWQRGVALLVLVAAAVGVTVLSSALSVGPEHAWAWLDGAARSGLVLGLALGLLLIPVPARAALALGLLALGVQLTLLNQAAVDPYFEQTRQVWEQGRFVRFNGLTQWLGWLWPFAALVHLLTRISSAAAGGARSGRDDTGA